MAAIVLVLGGVRSGKSRFAQQLAERLGGTEVLFVATAEAGDEEMRQRIATHRRDRPAAWGVLEAARHVGQAIREAEAPQPVVLLDCLTLLVSNVLLAAGDEPTLAAAQESLDAEIASLLEACRQRAGTVIIVSGEVGSGIVPENRLARLFRDLLGWANQRIAAEAKATYLLVADLPIELKSLAVSIDDAVDRL